MKEIIKQIILAFVTYEAKLILKKYKPKIIAVTGNIGKTSTKDAIHSVLASNFHVRKSAKSFNSEFGVPLTILGIDYLPSSNPLEWANILFVGIEQILFTDDYPKVLVLEVGADHKGDIKQITRFVHPDISVITQFQPVPVHIENFASREELIAEKGNLVHATKKNGLVLYTSDDHDSHELAKQAKCAIESYGFENWSDIRATSVDTLYEQFGEYEYPKGTAARIEMGDETATLMIPGVLGGGSVYASLAALYIGTKFGISLEDGAQVLSASFRAPGRMRILRGVKYSTIIDDTYNASPKAVEHALKTLSSLHIDGKKIAVLGDMLELGKQSVEEHARIGALAAKSAHYLVCVGKRAQTMAEAALDAGMPESCIFQEDTSVSARKLVESLIGKEDVILVKGSQGMRMERIVEEIMAEPDRKSELLVRQDAGWKN